MDGPVEADDAPLFRPPPACPPPVCSPQVCSPQVPVFGTSHHAGLQAARKSSSRRAQILAVLDDAGGAGAALFEVARCLGVADHVISGRFTDLNRDGMIESTGVCRRHPKSGCLCEVWRICAAMKDGG